MTKFPTYKKCWKRSGIYLIAFFLAIMLGCQSGMNIHADSALDNEVAKQGVVILRPKAGEVVKSTDFIVKKLVAEALRGERYYLHIYLNGEIVNHIPVEDQLKIEDLDNGLYDLELVVADHGHDEHLETKYRDSVAFIVEGVKERGKTGLVSSALPVSLKPGHGFSSPEEAFNALLDLMITKDDDTYEKLLGRPYEGTRKHHGNKKHMGSKPNIIEISDMKIEKKGVETIRGIKLNYIISKQTWHFDDGVIKKMKLDLHFKKIDKKWIFFPIKGQKIPY